MSKENNPERTTEEFDLHIQQILEGWPVADVRELMLAIEAALQNGAEPGA